MTDESLLDELRLFLENVCCDALRFAHVALDGVAPEDVHIRQEVALRPGAFADLVVAARGRSPYYVEVDYGYSRARLLESLSRKYGRGTTDPVGASRLVLVIDTERRSDWPALEAEAREALRPGLSLEVWNETRLRELVATHFGLAIDSLDEPALLDLRVAVDAVKGRHAFGDAFHADALESMLLLHFAFWRLRQLRERGRKSPRDVLPPGSYPGVIVVMADLSGYTSLVRDTHDDAVVRRSLTAFATKTRYQIINDGGMMYQVLGDAVIGLFGLPERGDDDVTRALGCATALLDIGASVAREWQRQIDHVQGSAGVHVSMTQGDLQVVSLRPFSRTDIGAVGDAVNLADRLNALSGTGEIVMSNRLYQRLPERYRAEFVEMEPVDAKNLGRVHAWKRAARASRRA
jgi:adenylate cyclase